MPTSRIRQLAAVGMLTLSVAAPLAACAADPVTPRAAPGAPAGPSTSATPAPARPADATGTSPPAAVQPPATVKPDHTGKTTPRSKDSACFGAVRHDIDLQDTLLDPQKTMCFRVGGILRLRNIGPGLVNSEPTSVVSGHYEAGVVDLRFIRPGTATVTIRQDDRTPTITVKVIR